MSDSDRPIFREVQYIRSVWWIMLLVYAIAALMWWGFIEQIILGQPWGSNPGPDWMIWLFWIFIGIGFPVIFNLIRLTVAVWPDRVVAQYRPIHTRVIPYTEIESITAHNYKPVRDYGGWGIKGWSGRRIAYNVKGKSGVELMLTDDRSVMLGSQDANRLAFAIEEQWHHSRTGG